MLDTASLWAGALMGAGMGGVAAAFMFCCVKETLVKQPQYEQVPQEKVAAGGLNEGEDDLTLTSSPSP